METSFLSHDNSKPLSIFASQTTRHDPTKKGFYIPGPGQYEVKDHPLYIKRARDIQNFGSLAQRESLIARDIMISPFKDPSHIDNPPVTKYNRA